LPIIGHVLVSDFHYDLPPELIAQAPLADRAASRMLRLSGATGVVEDGRFRDFPEALRQDDLVVFNNTRVFPARLFGRRAGARAMGVSARNPSAKEFLKGRVEVLLTRQVRENPNEWECLVRPGRKIGVGERIFFGEDELQAEVIGRGEFGERRVRFEFLMDVTNSDLTKIPTLTAKDAARMGHPDKIPTLSRKEREIRMGHPGEMRVRQPGEISEGFFALIEKIGHVPLPPYIAREDAAGDRERYQTVYARERGSVAAPTAGLHFAPEILARMRERGIETAEITLHVGLGTFQPVRSERVEEHKLHTEAYSISEATAEKINRAKKESRRVVAVGTTTVRTLEFAAQGSGEVQAGTGEADLFIYPGYGFRVVGALLTNFHLPQSTLLMLVCALGGKENVMRAYRHAVEQSYRFYSYGDCMLVE
jgi:S-adenosylmethionine:tRNA ribosyltransferase-isomerase